jgi:hypothetical protein
MILLHKIPTFHELCYVLLILLKGYFVILNQLKIRFICNNQELCLLRITSP